MPADRVPVKVRRLDVPRFRLFQLAAVAMVGLSALGRQARGLRVGVFAGVVAVFAALFVAALVLGLRAYRWLGRQELAFEEDQVLIGDGLAVRGQDVRMWAVGEGEARLYDADSRFVWRFLVDDQRLETLRANLTKIFGVSRLIVRRGSRRARSVAGGLVLAGLALFAAGVGADSPALGWSAVPVVVLAFASFMLQSQKMVRPESPGTANRRATRVKSSSNVSSTTAHGDCAAPLGERGHRRPGTGRRRGRAG
jgi:hypothetical protein